MSTGNIKMKCAKCGGTSFSHPDNPQPDDLLTCTSCGASGRYGVAQAALKKAEDARLQRLVLEKFKGLEGFKVKK